MEMVKWNKRYNSLDVNSRTTKRIGDKTMKRTKEEIEKLQRYMNRIFPYYYRDNSIREGIKSVVNAIPK